MGIYIASFIIVTLALAGMAVGVLMRGRPIKGSCGGLGAALGEDASCPYCSDEPERCPEQRPERPARSSRGAGQHTR